MIFKKYVPGSRSETDMPWRRRMNLHASPYHPIKARGVAEVFNFRAGALEPSAASSVMGRCPTPDGRFSQSKPWTASLLNPAAEILSEHPASSQNTQSAASHLDGWRERTACTDLHQNSARCEQAGWSGAARSRSMAQPGLRHPREDGSSRDARAYAHARGQASGVANTGCLSRLIAHKTVRICGSPSSSPPARRPEAGPISPLTRSWNSYLPPARASALMCHPRACRRTAETPSCALRVRQKGREAGGRSPRPSSGCSRPPFERESEIRWGSIESWAQQTQKASAPSAQHAQEGSAWGAGLRRGRQRADNCPQSRTRRPKAGASGTKHVLRAHGGRGRLPPRASLNATGVPPARWPGLLRVRNRGADQIAQRSGKVERGGCRRRRTGKTAVRGEGQGCHEASPPTAGRAQCTPRSFHARQAAFHGELESSTLLASRQAHVASALARGPRKDPAGRGMRGDEENVPGFAAGRRAIYRSSALGAARNTRSELEDIDVKRLEHEMYDIWPVLGTSTRLRD
ncbi:hypothetical protein C2E23DRAFT_937532 [Lenzites betulinus]|nr:hypothetical protein C2E23DRAFT_937532 [Lenzites betulinus]